MTKFCCEEMEDSEIHDTEADVHGDQDEEEKMEPSTCVRKLTGLVLVILSIILYFYTLYIVISVLVYPGSISPLLSASPPPRQDENETSDPNLTQAILQDAALLWVFVLQHSLMACGALRQLCDGLNMSAILRPLYTICTCCVMQVVHHFWVPVPTHVIWHVDSCLLHYVLLIVHIASWLSVACSILTIDYLELLGLRQIYYSFSGLENPMHYKSAEQQQLLEHMRHPIFLAPLIILWAVPVMTYDRLLVAVMLPLYLGWGSSINHLDASYIKQQFRMKRIQLLGDGSIKSD